MSRLTSGYCRPNPSQISEDTIQLVADMETALVWALALSVTLVSYTMAHIVDQPSWYSRIVNLVILPSEFQSFVRIVSLLCVSRGLTVRSS